MKTLVYTKTRPTIEGMYWHLADLHGDPAIVRVFKDADGYWSVQYDNLHLRPEIAWSDKAEGTEFEGGVDFLENYRHGFWAGPIPVPHKPKSPDGIDLS